MYCVLDVSIIAAKTVEEHHVKNGERGRGIKRLHFALLDLFNYTDKNPTHYIVSEEAIKSQTNFQKSIVFFFVSFYKHHLYNNIH